MSELLCHYGHNLTGSHPTREGDDTEITVITSPGCTKCAAAESALLQKVRCCRKCAAAERVLTEVLADYQESTLDALQIGVTG